MGRKKVEINPIRGERLGKLLKKYGVEQKDFADEMGYSEEHISYIINGKRNLTQDAAEKIVEKFPGTRIGWLLGYEDFETDILEQGYRAIRPYMEKQKRKKAVSTFFSSLSLSFSPNVPEQSLLNLSADKLISKFKDGDIQKVLEEYESLMQSRSAYIIEKDGEIWGYCSNEEMETLFEEVFDFAEFALLKLCNREEQRNG